jgi:hypothetical protein
VNINQTLVFVFIPSGNQNEDASTVAAQAQAALIVEQQQVQQNTSKDSKKNSKNSKLSNSSRYEHGAIKTMHLLIRFIRVFNLNLK